MEKLFHVESLIWSSHYAQSLNNHTNALKAHYQKSVFAGQGYNKMDEQGFDEQN